MIIVIIIVTIFILMSITTVFSLLLYQVHVMYGVESGSGKWEVHGNMESWKVEMKKRLDD